MVTRVAWEGSRSKHSTVVAGCFLAALVFVSSAVQTSDLQTQGSNVNSGTKAARKAIWDFVGQLTPPPPAGIGTCRGGQAVASEALTAALGCPGTAHLGDGVYMYFGDEIFTDGFESGNTSAWTSSVP